MAESLLDRMLLGELDPRHTPTLRDYFGALIRAKEDEPEPGEPGLASVYYTECRSRIADRVQTGTWTIYEKAWRVWLCENPIAKMPVGEVKKQHVQRLIDQMRRDRAWGTTRRYGSCIHAVFEEAILDGLIKENPATKINYGKKTRKKPYVLSPRQSVDVPTAMNLYNPQLARMTILEIDGGLRPGEVCGLRTEDIEQPEPGCWGIWVRRAIGRQGEVKRVKDDEERFVYLTDDALDAIKQELGGRRSGSIFETDDGTPMRPDYMTKQMGRFRRHQQKLMNAAAEELGDLPSSVPQLTNRGFRRTFATRGVRSGDLKSTQFLLGHATSKMTADIYAEAEDEGMRDTVRAIQAKVGYRRLFCEE